MSLDTPDARYSAQVLGGILVAVNVAHTVFAEMAADPDGSFPFYESSAVLVAELGKLILAALLLLRAYMSRTPETLGSNQYTITRGVLLKTAIPGLLYTVSNILSYTTVGLLGSTGYQLFSNIKIIVTAITFRLVIRKPLKVIQWLCLILLAAGLLSAGDVCTDPGRVSKPGRFLEGVVLVLLLSICSSLANVYYELQLKEAPQHPLLQNMLLYFWTCLFCVIQYARASTLEAEGVGGALNVGGFFKGFSLALWGAIITTAMYGQVVSLILCYCDNIVKIFANSATVVAAAVVDALFFGKLAGLHVWNAGVIVGFCTLAYYGNHATLLLEDLQAIRRHCSKSTSELDDSESRAII